MSMLYLGSGLRFAWANGEAVAAPTGAVETWVHNWTVRDDVFFSYPNRVRNEKFVEQGHTESTDPAEDTSP